MANAVWTGSLSLGLVVVPVRLYPAIKKKVVRFHLGKDNPSRNQLLAVLLGPSGNLRAPTLRKGKKLLVGFDAGAYEEVLG